jgi:membrane protein YqaA with SNARE-associated domain
MNLGKLPHWLQAAVGSFGGVGLLLVAFLDSSVFTFPVINDLLVIHLSIKSPAKMPYYALMATLGSLAGCVFLYFLARKGGEIAFRHHAGPHADRIHTWVNRNGFLTILIAAMLPPPLPLKPFVLAAGVFEVPLRAFTLALVLARALRYFGEGYFAIRYGTEAIHYLGKHKLQITLIGLVAVVGVYWISRSFFPAMRRGKKSSLGG